MERIMLLFVRHLLELSRHIEHVRQKSERSSLQCEVEMAKGFICFFIQQYLEHFCFQSSNFTHFLVYIYNHDFHTLFIT